MSNISEIVLSAKQISISFNKVRLIDNLSFDIRKGEKVVIKGQSGKGKTTIINAILGFIMADSGKLEVNGISLSPETVLKYRENITWTPQDLSFNITTRELIKQISSNTEKQIFRFDNTKFMACIEQLGLTNDINEKNIQQLSGGERQRLFVSISLAMNRPLLLLDEPVSALDIEMKERVINLVLKNSENTVLSTSHDENWISNCSKIIEI